jgi:electron transfer flavoprotein alpha subunit
MARTILVIAEHRDGALKGISKEAACCALDLAPRMSATVVGVVLGPGTQSVAQELATWGCAQVLLVEDGALAAYTPEGYVAALHQLVQRHTPALVITGHSYQAIEFFPRLAAALDAALVPDCTGIDVDGVRPVFTRKVINGKLNARCTVEGDGPWLASLQQGAFPARKPQAAAGTVVSETVDLARVRPRTVVSVQPGQKGEVDLTKAEVIVAGGRGVGGKEKFKIVFDLASALGSSAAVGASRPPCDAEWVEHERQIGSSGQVVAPKLYIALGISGAIQHLVGMRGAQCIVAINKDANAAIFQEATYGIVGDVHEIVPALIAAIQEAKSA